MIPQTIKDTLPYFLGAINSERVRLEHELRLAKRTLKLVSRDLDEASSIASDKLRRGQSLITEAQQVGIVRTDVVGETEEVLGLLKNVLTWSPAAAPLVEEDRLGNLRNLADRRRADFKHLQRQIEAAETFQRDAQAYAGEAGEQVMRLSSIGLFDGAAESHRCPICSSDSLPKSRQ